LFSEAQRHCRLTKVRRIKLDLFVPPKPFANTAIVLHEIAIGECKHLCLCKALQNDESNY